MLADMAVGSLFEHASTAGAATEHHWINLFLRYLPKRYRAAPAFVIDSDGRRSRQIDIAIFDNLYSPPLFPHDAGLHVPAESVYAVFEVKPTISKQWLRDAGEKAASVRTLRRTSAPIIASGALRRSPIRPQPILAALLATSSVWSAETFAENVRRAMGCAMGTDEIGDCPELPHGPRKQTIAASGRTVPNFKTHTASPAPLHTSARGQTDRQQRSPSPSPRPPSPSELHRIDLGCSLQHGAFEQLDIRSPEFPSPHIQVSDPDESLIFFMLRLLDRLRAMGTTPAADLMEYGRTLRSFRRT